MIAIAHPTTNSNVPVAFTFIGSNPYNTYPLEARHGFLGVLFLMRK